jgi:MFS family permease
MNKKTLIGLILCYFVVNTMGNGIMPLMPLFVQLHGASEGLSGVYVAFAYFCLAAGTMFGGRISDRVTDRRRLLIIVSIFISPVTFLLGRVDSLLAVVLITGFQWILAGFCMAIIGTIMGREAAESERGRVFGLLGVSIGMGALVGGFTIGPMVDAWGYRVMFTIMSVFLLTVPLTAFIVIRETATLKVAARKKSGKRTGSIEIAFVILLAAQFLGLIANGVGNMTRTISMNQLQFSSTAMTSTIAVAGIISIPLALFLGWLSDKLGRKKILFFCYLFGSICLLILIAASRYWHFLFAAGLLSMVVVNMSVGPAFVADIVKKETVGTGIALIQSIQLLGTIVGFIYTGYAINILGMTTALLIASFGGLAAAILILFVRPKVADKSS